MTLSERLKKLRGSMSQAAFAKIVNASQSSITNYEKGRLPDSGFIESVCNQFGVSADWLLFGTESKGATEQTAKTSNVGGFLESKKNKPIEIIDEYKNKISNVGGFPSPEDASTLVAMSHELMEAVKEIRTLNAEKRDLQNRIAELEKNVEALTAKASTAPAASVAQKSDSANEVPTPKHPVQFYRPGSHSK